MSSPRVLLRRRFTRHRSNWVAQWPQHQIVFSGLFYQRYWSTLDLDDLTMVTTFLKSGILPLTLNKTTIIIIPKVADRKFPDHFRLIRHCNFSYKNILKVLTNILKPFLRDIITPFKSAFLLGRKIQDNVLIAHDAFYYN